VKESNREKMMRGREKRDSENISESSRKIV
jgi:hypothetical protein